MRVPHLEGDAYYSHLYFVEIFKIWLYFVKKPDGDAVFVIL